MTVATLKMARRDESRNISKNGLTFWLWESRESEETKVPEIFNPKVS